MTATYRVGAATGAGCIAYARYVIESALAQEHAAAAEYYAGDVWARDVPEPSAELRPDLSRRFAERLGIDLSRPLSLTQIASLMNNLTAEGTEIEGKKRHSVHQSVASVFGLDLKAPPSVAEIENVLAGKRVDGAMPRAETGNGEPLSAKVVESSLRKFKVAIGAPTTGDATAEEIARVAEGRIDVGEYRKHITATSPPVGFVDITFSADKSVSISYALAPTEVERNILLSAVHHATADAMAYVESVLGVARRGAGGQGEPEPAEMAWIGFQHYTSRPAVDVVRTNAQGEVFTDTREVPTESADPNLHQHRIVLSSLLSESGRIGSLDLSRLEGEMKVFGAVFHAGIATRLRKYGADVVLGPHGEARIAGQSDWLRKFYSRRTTQGEDSAKAWAAERGTDWNALSGEEQIALVQAGAAATRQDKIKRGADEGLGEIKTWQQDAVTAGYSHRSVLRPDQDVPVLSDTERIQIARAASMPLLDAAFRQDAVLPEGTIREIAARGLIVSGLGRRATDDIDAIVQTYKDQGVTIAGAPTKLIWGVEYGTDGRPRTVVTTGHNLTQEEELIGLAKAMAADTSGALTPAQIDRAAERVLARHPKIDPKGPQWQAQIKMAHTLGEGPRVGMAVGIAGSGKTRSVVATLTAAWHDAGKTVIAMTVPWRANAPLLEAGVDMAMAVDAFVRRVQTGKLKIDSNTVIVADEVSMIGVRQQLDLLRIAQAHGARVIEIGDPRQCGAVETPAIDLMSKAIGDEQIPKLLTSIRQKTRRAKDIATMFRDGRAAEGLAAMREDGDFTLVAGGVEATIKDTVASWRRRTDANAGDPDYALIVMTPTNDRVLDIGKAIREDRRAAGEIGQDDVIVRAKITPKGPGVVELPLAVGDKVRPFHRLYDADTPGRSKYLAANGDVVEIRQVLPDGLRIRNADGEEGRITWSQLKPFRAPKNDPVILTYGYVSSIDAAQSLTRTEAILSLPDGSRAVNGNKAYTALSRHTDEVEMIVSDAAERRQILNKQMLGLAREPPREAEVVRNIAVNLSRFQKRRLATEMRRQDGPPPITSAQREAARQQPEATTASAEQLKEAIAHSPIRLLTGPGQGRREKRSMRSAAERPKRPAPAPRPAASETDIRSEFADALRRSGFRLRGNPEMDGAWHRAQVEGDLGRKMSGRYRGYLDGRPAGFIENYKAGIAQPWRSEGPAPAMTAAAYRQREADRVARESERSAREERAAVRAMGIWGRAKPATQHAYLDRKDVAAHGIRQTSDGRLVVPLQDTDGTIRNVQTIKPDGEKRFVKGGQKGGLFALVGEIEPGKPLLIAEGFATAATLREVTGLPVVVAFDAGNLHPVAQTIRAKHPDAPMVFAADNDHQLPRRDHPLPNIGKEKAQAASAAVGGIVIAPSFGDVERQPLIEGRKPPTNWNDYAAINGKNKLRQVLAAQFKSKGIAMDDKWTDVGQKVTQKVTQAERDAARQTSVAASQNLAQQDAMREQQRHQHRLGHNRGR